MSAQSQTLNLTIIVDNVKSSTGSLIICVFNKETGFPEKSNLAVKCVTVNAEKGTTQVKLEGIASNKYAISVHHDENNDGKVNMNFIHIPKESTGASNGAKGKMGPPKFSDAALFIDKNNTHIKIVLD